MKAAMIVLFFLPQDFIPPESTLTCLWGETNRFSFLNRLHRLLIAPQPAYSLIYDHSGMLVRLSLTYIGITSILSIVFLSLIPFRNKTAQNSKKQTVVKIIIANLTFLIVLNTIVMPSGITQDVVPYDLYGTDTRNRGLIPFAVNWPARPEGALTPLTVSDAASLSAAIASPGAIISVKAGSYGTLALRQDDQHWILDDNAEFSGLTATGRPMRVIVQGGVINPGKNTAIALVVDDFLMTNLKIPAVKNLAFGVGSSMSHRVAFNHNTVVAQNVAFLTPGATASDVGAFGSDMIIAANYLQGGMTIGKNGAVPALRVQSNHRTIIVDNRVRTGFDDQATKHAYRSHYGNQSYFMRRNINEYGGGIYFQPRANRRPVFPSNYMGDHWVYDHLNYYNRPGNPGSGPEGIADSFRHDASSKTWPGRLVAVDNIAYRGVQKNRAGVLDNRGRWRWNAKAGDVISNNIEFPCQPPPALNAWLSADGLPPGADHWTKTDFSLSSCLLS